MTTPVHLTSAGKEALRKTIRGLREALIAQLKEAAEREYRLGVPLDKARLPEDKAKKRARLEAWADEQGRADWPLAKGAKGAKASKGKKSAKGAKATKASAAATRDEAAMSDEAAIRDDAAPERKRPSDKQLEVLRERYLLQAVKEAAHTLVNRLVIVRILEHAGLSKPAVVTGGFKSAGYREFTEYAQALCSDENDDTKGYAALLQLLFDELALELPGVFGNVGLTRLFPVPAATLRQVIEALNEPALDSAWGDDTTLGWVYQFWNDPEREALDDKINSGGKIEPHEIAPKTQMFTERYMVEWLLQNSLGQTWLAMCKKHGWTADFEQVRAGLDGRRAAWRKHREAGQVAADELMPFESPLEEQWKYWVPQPMPEDAPNTAPDSLRELKLLDPACGSGHFLVIAFDLLALLYQEEARHRGESWSSERIARFIVEDNLHGIDIDPRAIQIAAAAVWLKAKTFAPGVRLRRMNLVAPTFKLAALSSSDPALVRLQERLEGEVGLPKSLTRQLVQALDGVDHLGSLLRVDTSIRSALEAYAKEHFGLSAPKAQGELFVEEKTSRIQLSLDEAMNRVMTQLGRFLDAHQGEGDLGLRLEGQQLAAGVRFVQMAREGAYDVVVANPPYQGTSRMAEVDWFKKQYSLGKADLYSCFLLRVQELARAGGICSVVSMRGWMFLSQFTALREHLLRHSALQCVGDLGTGAFASRSMDDVISTALCQFRVGKPQRGSVAVKTMPLVDKARDAGKPARRRAALYAHDERYEFDVGKLAGIEGTPLVYWWDETFLDEYIKAPKLGDVAPAREGLSSANNERFIRRPWELTRIVATQWEPYVRGAEGRAWFEPIDWVLSWRPSGLAVRTQELGGAARATVRNEQFYLRRGVAFTTIGNTFAGRLYRVPSIFDTKGRSVFSDVPTDTLCSMNSTYTRRIVTSLNPGIDFTVGDVNRIPVRTDVHAPRIVTTVCAAFTHHESHRESSVEFKSPGPSPWRYAQDWAQRAVDRAKGEPLPPYEPEFDPPDPTSFVSFAIGVALGRFGQNGEGILDLSLPSAPGSTAQAERRESDAPSAGAKTRAGSNGQSPSTATKKRSAPSTGSSSPSTSPTVSGGVGNGVTIASDASGPVEAAGLPEVPNIEPSPLPAGQVILPDGILFVSCLPHLTDSLSHPAAERIVSAWSEHGAAVVGSASKGGKSAPSLEEWLRKDFFAYHKGLYENRPIYFPLSSENKSFVAWVSIHRFADNTLQALLANHLHPAQKQLQGEISDLNAARASSDKRQRANAEKQYAKSQKLLEELDAFVSAVTQCAEKGAPPTDAKCTARQVDAPFVMDLDDGVMINSAALWPLLSPQWKDPKKWWKELCTPDGRKDYDWAHLAARYFPTRVDEKCRTDPSLAVAHHCFWKYHPPKAYAWELRLQDEIAADFTIDEPDSNEARAAFLATHPDQAREIEAKEQQRRERNRKKAEKAADAETSNDEDAGELDADDDEPRQAHLELD